MSISTWLGWFTQHPFGKLLWLAGLGWILATLGRWIYCGFQLSRLHSQLRNLPAGARQEVDGLFQQLPLGRLRLAWSAGPAGLRSWQLEYWAHPLLGGLRWSVWPTTFLLASPWLVWLGYLQGYRRFDKELQFLSTLQPWEGLRALQIVRHAGHSLVTWAEPLVAAGLGALALALAIALLQMLSGVSLVRQLGRVQVELLRIFPTSSQDELSQQLQQLQKLVNELREDIRQLRATA